MPLIPNIEVDYEFCKSSKLTALDLLTWLDLDDLLDVHDHYAWSFFGRNLRIVDQEIQVSCIHKDFDRWANSREMEFDITKRGDRRDFIQFVIDERKKLTIEKNENKKEK